MNGQNVNKVLDYRDPVCGEYYQYFGNCAFSSTCCSSYMFYVKVEKSVTSIDSIIITDSSLIDYSASYLRRYAKLNTDSTWFNSFSYYGNFKKKDTMVRTLIIPGPSYCNAMSKKINSPLGINPIKSNLEKINIYPNPSNDKLFISALNNNINMEKFILFNREGKKVLVINDIGQAMDVSHLPTGLYFLQVQTNEGILNKKIVIQH